MTIAQASIDVYVGQRQEFLPGLYEIVYAFTAPEFDPETMYFDWHGRRTGPWDYAPSGPHNGDCLLPYVTLVRNDAQDFRARVFIPRQEELDRRWFNGRIGFYVEKTAELELRLTASLPVCWDKAEIIRVEDFSDEKITRVGLDTTRRFWLDDESLAVLRRNWSLAPWCRRIDQILDQLSGQPPPPSLELARTVVSRHLPPECRCEDDVVFWGDYLAALSLRLLVLDRQDDFMQLRSWIEALIKLPIWGSSDDPKGRDHNNDLTADFNMFGLTLALNWHGHRFDADLVSRIKAKIAYQAGEMFKWITGARSSWPGTQSQNHAFFGFQTMLLAGAALIDDDPRALGWIRIAAAAFRKFVRRLPSDGSFHEGIGYIFFGLLGLMPSLFLFEQLTGREWLPLTWLDCHWQAMNDFSPDDLSAGFAIDDGDATVPCFEPLTLWALRHAPSESSRIAAGELLRKIAAAKLGLNHNWLCGNFWNLVLAPEIVDLDAELSCRPTSAPLQRYLPAAGYFIFTPRSDWKAYLFTAPPHGFELFNVEQHTYSYGHHHPDTGNVLLNYRGRWALADTGYTYCKAGSEHNILLFDGQGQHNDNYVWMPPPPWNMTPQQPRFAEYPWGVETSVELSCYYPARLGLTRWQRTLFGFREGAMVVVDEVAAVQPGIFTVSWGSDFSWRENETGFVNDAGIILCLAGESVDTVGETVIPARRYAANVKPWYAIRLRSPAPESARRFVSVFLPVDASFSATELLQRCGVNR